MANTNRFISVFSNKGSILIRELQKRIPNYRIYEIRNADDPILNQTNILIGDFDLIGPHIYNLANVEWIQGTWAGVDGLLPYINPDNLPKFPITRFAGKHFGSLMGEYVLCNIINHERDFFKLKENQRKNIWLQEGKISNHRTLNDLKIGILGMGNIGEKIAQTLKSLGSEIHGLGRRSSRNFLTNSISKYYSKDELSNLLQSCDYIVNVLPNTNETKGLLNGSVLENCKEKSSVFINIGRASIISEECLLKALKCQWISAAILDVFEEEPLREDSPLWNMTNVFISPHVAGVSRPQDIAEQFCENLKNFEQCQSFPTQIDFKRGY